MKEPKRASLETPEAVLDFVRRAREMMAGCRRTGRDPSVVIPGGEHIRLLDPETDELLNLMEFVARERMKG